MSTQYSSDRPRPSQGASRNPARPGAPRPAGARPASGRPSGARPASARPSGSRPTQGHPAGRRPPQGRRPAPRRRRKPQGRFYAILAAAAVLIVALIVLIVKLSGGRDTPANSNSAVPTEAPVATEAPAELTSASVETDAATDQTTTASSHSDSLAAMLGSDDASQVTGLSADEMAQVSDLSINQSLPQEWMNILLLGSDERKISDSARTDCMIICSIHLPTGKVKLTSIMRDLAVNFDDIGKFNGTYRINAANYFGGERLAMKTVNECFGLNIEKYVRVNFFGFQEIAHMLGGIDMTISEDEMNLINKYIVEQAKFAYYAGFDDSNLPKEFLETYGDNVHLDGRQTLAYARIRKLDGGDFARSERQRKVLVALMEKLRGQGAADLLSLANAAMPYLQTNLTVAEILAVATTVVGSDDLGNVDTFRLPANDTYVQETRNEQSMFYDCDWAANTSQLYNFIYE